MGRERVGSEYIYQMGLERNTKWDERVVIEYVYQMGIERNTRWDENRGD
jgi:hypothetical protein